MNLYCLISSIILTNILKANTLGITFKILKSCKNLKYTDLGKEEFEQ